MTDDEAPERYYHVSNTQLSIARYYGWCRVNGHDYVYDPATDTLTRADVLEREEKARKAASRKRRKPPTGQKDLFLDIE